MPVTDATLNVVRPTDANWDAARQAFNLAVDQQPAAVAFPAGPGEVAAVIRAARAEGLRVAPQRTGHGAHPKALEDTMLLKTERMQGVQVDPKARRARVAAGAQWQDLVPVAAEHGLAALHGSAPDIGIVGYSLGGGFGFYGRKHGLQSNSVTAVELVTADGELRRVDAEHESEVFWALRGGGGNFGVVTALEFDLYEIAEVYAGMMIWPWERSSDVLHAWHEMTKGAPDELTTTARILQIPPLPEIPELIRGRSIVVVNGAHLGAEAEGAELLQPLRDLGPELDTWAMTAAQDLMYLHMDPPDPLPYLSTHRLLSDVDAQTIDRMVEVGGPGSGSPLVGVELRQTGGAVGRSEPGHGALDRFAGSYLSFAFGPAMEPEMIPPVEAHLDNVSDVFEPLDAGTGYLNFVERECDASTFFESERLERLRQVRSEYDPDGTFRANHEI